MHFAKYLEAELTRGTVNGVEPRAEGKFTETAGLGYAEGVHLSTCVGFGIGLDYWTNAPEDRRGLGCRN